jgi:hypothetical protein
MVMPFSSVVRHALFVPAAERYPIMCRAHVVGYRLRVTGASGRRKASDYDRRRRRATYRSVMAECTEHSEGREGMTKRGESSMAKKSRKKKARKKNAANHGKRPNS